MNTKYLADLVERTAASYVLAFLGLLLTSGFDLTDLSAVKAAAVAAVPAVLQAVYGVLTKFVGNPDAAGLVNTSRD